MTWTKDLFARSTLYIVQDVYVIVGGWTPNTQAAGAVTRAVSDCVTERQGGGVS